MGRASGVCVLVVKIQNWYAERVGLEDLTYERWTSQIHSFSEEGCATPGTVVITAASESLDISEVFSNRRMVWCDLENQEAGK